MSRAAVSALVSTLQRDGMIHKERAVHDGRAVPLTLTDKGPATIVDDFRADDDREGEFGQGARQAIGGLPSAEPLRADRLLGPGPQGSG